MKTKICGISDSNTWIIVCPDEYLEFEVDDIEEKVWVL